MPKTTEMTLGRQGNPDAPRAKDGSFRGRPKGAKTKTKELLEAAQVAVRKKFPDEFKDREFDPIIEMALIAADSDNGAALRLSAAHKMAPFVHARVANIEISGEIDHNHKATSSDAQNQLAKLMGLDPEEVEKAKIIDVTDFDEIEPIVVPDEIIGELLEDDDES
jgi:hypothetical protein